MTHISTYFNEQSSARAEVKLNNGFYVIEYYDQAGKLYKTEEYRDNSLHYVESAAENWALGIKQLNG